MIINQDVSQTTVVGDIQKNKVNIDAENVNFITTLLTSNLYSLPIESFFREIVSNAWDSQVEAGNTDTPILVKIYKVQESSDLEISIRDYGTGLSPERFDQIFRSIGSSTKRQSNDFIGALGIGKYASLAVSNVVSLKSYYNGKRYLYMMYKDGEAISIDLLNTIDTEFENGLEVSVTIPYSSTVYEHIQKGLTMLSFFEQLYVDNDDVRLESFVNEFNQRQIHEFNTFKVCSMSNLRGSYYLMGNVLYPAKNVLEMDRFNSSFQAAIKLDIGSVDITPNREDLQYSKKTIDTTTARIEDVKEEIIGLFEKELNKDFNSILEYFTTYRSYHSSCYDNTYTIRIWDFKTWKISSTLTWHIIRSYNLIKNPTIKGKPIPKDLYDVYWYLALYKLPSSFATCVLYNHTYCPGSAVNAQSILFGCDYIKVCITDEPFKRLTKSYVKQCADFDGHVIFINRSKIKEVFYTTFNAFKQSWNKTHDYFPYEAVRLFYDEVVDHFSKMSSFNNTDVPKWWIEAQKETTKPSTTRNKLVIHMLGRSNNYDYVTSFYKTTSYATNKTFDSLASDYDYIVYDVRSSKDLRFIHQIFYTANRIGNVAFIELAQSNLKHVPKNNKFVHVGDFIRNNSLLKSLCTGLYIKDKQEKALNRLANISSSLLRHIDLKFSHIIDLLETLIKTNDMEKKLKPYVEFYLENGLLDTELIDIVTSDDYYQLVRFVVYNNSALVLNSLEEYAAISYMLKHNLKIGNINRVEMYKALKKMI